MFRYWGLELKVVARQLVRCMVQQGYIGSW